jgi:hypothetical protein
MSVYAKADIDVEELESFIDGYGGAIRLLPGSTPQFVWKVTRQKFGNAAEYLTGLKQLMTDMRNRLVKI